MRRCDMKRWLGPLLVMTLTTVFAHWLALGLAPGFIMARAMAALEARGVALHAFTTPERITPQTQEVVRSSPDLYYALCRYDLTEPEDRESGDTWLEVTMASWDGYQSLSFFDARTNNFATIRGTGKAIRAELRPDIGDTGMIEPLLGFNPLNGGPVVKVGTSTKTGVILIRRLAPTADDFARATEAGKGDSCRVVTKPTIVY